MAPTAKLFQPEATGALVEVPIQNQNPPRRAGDSQRRRQIADSRRRVVRENRCEFFGAEPAIPFRVRPVTKRLYPLLIFVCRARELSWASPDSAISDIANKWGFRHMSQLARDLRKLFRERFETRATKAAIKLR